MRSRPPIKTPAITIPLIVTTPPSGSSSFGRTDGEGDGLWFWPACPCGALEAISRAEGMCTASPVGSRTSRAGALDGTSATTRTTSGSSLRITTRV